MPRHTVCGAEERPKKPSGKYTSRTLRIAGGDTILTFRAAFYKGARYFDEEIQS